MSSDEGRGGSVTSSYADDHVDDTVAWDVTDVSREELAEALMAEVLAQPALREQVDLAHDLRWLRTYLPGAGRRLVVAVLRRAGAPVGFAPFLLHPSALRLALGEMTVVSRDIQRWTAVAPPLIGVPRPEDTLRALRGLLQSIRRALGRREVFYVEGLPQESPLFGLLTGPRASRAGYHALKFGRAYQHRSIALTADYETYLRTLGGKTREDLRRTRRRFSELMADEVEVRRYERADEVDTFLEAATAVSEKTWQYRQMDAGLRDRDALRARFRRTTELGWFRSYVLFARRAPVAFQVGHLYRGTFHAQDIGYDPDLAKLNPGIFLHTGILLDLTAQPGAVACFDFGQSDSLHKARLSNRFRTEAHFYLLPSGPAGTLTAYGMRTTNALSSSLGSALERMGVRRTARALIRRLGLAR